MQERNRINGFHAWAIISVSVMVDVIQLIFTLLIFTLLLSTVFAIITAIVFWVWFKVLDVGFMDTSSGFFKNYFKIVFEMIPILNIFPIFTIMTVFIISKVRKEDKKYNEEQISNLNAANDNRPPARLKKAV
ncbi:hypothetical protein COB52_03145 [Candidatus Kaiserbacteria bacterium]|nr:MAG: hypothetical protein COB52_03145 [Candidatus Kaiserbacteria bacterium]